MPILVTGRARSEVALDNKLVRHKDEFRESVKIDIQGRLRPFIYSITYYKSYIHAYVLGARDDKGKLVARFCPPAKVELLWLMHYYDDENLYIPPQDARRLNIALDYQVIMLLVRADTHVILPYEIKP